MTEYVVGSMDDFPVGSKRLVTVGGVEIGVFNVHGQYYALPNRCIHQGGPLCEGDVGGTVVATADNDWNVQWVQEGEIIICPWHRMEFNITTGRCLGRRRVHLHQYRVRVADGELLLTV